MLIPTVGLVLVSIYEQMGITYRFWECMALEKDCYGGGSTARQCLSVSYSTSHGKRKTSRLVRGLCIRY